jgi:lactoylglutathione lyase
MMKIEHIAMYVQDLEKTRDFFVKYFAAKSNAMYHNPNTDFKSYFLSFDDGARLEIMQKPGVEVQTENQMRTGFIHVAISVGSKEQVDKLTETLKQDGYTVTSGPRTTGDGYYESCVVAVEGNLIEITV